ncbi:hypothetical protein, partial [Pseudomonas aeruginosa]
YIGKRRSSGRLDGLSGSWFGLRRDRPAESEDNAGYFLRAMPPWSETRDDWADGPRQSLATKECPD